MSSGRNSGATRFFLFTACLVAVGLAAMVTGCGEEAVPPDAPSGHTVMKDGIPHAPGLENPSQNCSSCHGDDLKGGSEGEPSCYSCHGQEW